MPGRHWTAAAPLCTALQPPYRSCCQAYLEPQELFLKVVEGCGLLGGSLVRVLLPAQRCSGRYRRVVQHSVEPASKQSRVHALRCGGRCPRCIAATQGLG